MRFIKEQFIMSASFIRKKLVKPYITVFAIFLLFSVAVYLLMLAFPDVSKQLFEYIGEIFESSGVLDENGNISAFLLFLNNARAGFIGMVWGFIPFIFFPVFAVFINGAIMGVTFGAYSVFSEVSPLALLAAGILPHGIFELTAIFLCWAMGLGICLQLTKKIFGAKTDVSFSYYIKRCLGVYIFFVIPLLVAAAVVESYVTPVIMNLVIA